MLNPAQNQRVQYNDGTNGWVTISDGSTGFSLSRHRDQAGVIQLSLWDTLAIGLDPSIHPSNVQHMRKGQKLRVQSSNNGSTWVVEYTGTIRSVDVNPNISARRGNLRQITVKATNTVADMIGGSAGVGAGSTDDVRNVLPTGTFNVNGSTTTKVSPSTPTFTTDVGNMWSALMVTRDSQDFFLHVDKSDIVVVTDRSSKSTSSVATFTQSNYSDVVLNYNIEHIINDVTAQVTNGQKNGKTAITFAVHVQDPTSISKNGKFSSAYVWHNVANPTTKANAILTSNADPSTVPTGCTVPINSTSDITNFVQGIDLNDKVTITDLDGNTFSVRVQSIKHTVAPSSNGAVWNVQFGFIHPDLVAKARQVASSASGAAASTFTGIANVTTGQIENDQLDAQAVDGMTVTGAIVQTDSTGNRIVIYDDASAGVIEGWAGTAGESPLVINPYGSSSERGIQFTSGTDTSNPTAGRMVLHASNTPSGLVPMLELQGSTQLYVNSDAQVVGDLYMTGDFKSTSAVMDTTVVNGVIRVAGGVNITGKISTNFATATGVAVVLDTSRIVIGVQSYNASGGPTSGNTAPLHALDIHSYGGGIFLEDLTGSSTTATINTNGRIVRTTSSKRYKSNIKPLKLEQAHKALELVPVTYTRKDEAMTTNRKTYPGFIAEQAHDAGMSLWVNYDQDGKPDGFRYDELTAAHNLLIKELYERIEKLENK